ncbi:MAG: DUF4344 domain-containing metallopeptidase [Oleiphilaceae bacterium]|nr:DUF4344 domain-containing metallopeptidase [Oleiphilaceae bacterium]
MLAFCLLSAVARADSLNWHFQGLAPQHDVLFDVLDEQKLFARMSETMRQHLRLTKPIHVVFYPGAETFFDPQRDELFIPLSVLRRMRFDLAQRFPEQNEVQSAVYLVSVEYMLWYQLGRVLIHQYDIPSGVDAERSIDALATLVMLDSRQSLNHLYLLDAAEVLLLNMPSFQLWGDLSGRTQEEQREARYRLAVCLVLGEDHSELTQPLEDLGWSGDALKRCQQRLQLSRRAWSGLLRTQLSEWSSWRHWGLESKSFKP